MKRQSLILTSTILFLITSATYAQVISTAIMSPNCTEAQIKEIAGPALVSIGENKSWDKEVKGFDIKLDTSKMSYSDLVKKMEKQNCFNK